ncbi:MAG: ABC transporter ATP-binding protein [Promethearchaeota archaeon]|nr:MAG: ABC transporter ATP-binding protein [Candidatus Lokiarchaeota archaeon]
MKQPLNNSDNKPQVEFSLEKDPYLKSRQKGIRRWILAHIFKKSNSFFILVVFISTIIGAVLSSITMIIIGRAISDFMVGDDTNFSFYVIVLLLLSVGTPVLRLFNFMLREVLAQRMEFDVRKEFYLNLLGKSQSFHDRQKIGEIMARATDDVRSMNFLISPAISLILESFTNIIVPIIFIYLFYPTQLLFAPLLFTVLFLITLNSYSRKIGPVTRKLRKNFGLMSASLNETLTGIEIVKSISKEEGEAQKYSLHATNYKNAYEEQGRIQAKYLPIFIFAITATIALTHAIMLADLGMISIGEIIAYIGLISLLRFSTNISIFVFAIIKLAGASAKRLVDTMNEQTEIDENLGGTEKEIEGRIMFENVSFSYPGSSVPVLKNISFEIAAGKTVAIVGTTGSGKTTLTKLISRLYDVNKGRILIDGIDIKEYALNSLRSQISHIEQDVFLFSKSIFENISFGRTSSMEEIIQVSKEAQAHEFIISFPKGYDSEVGERGVTLSGGERQRIAIARAFLSDPKILILDDSTSAIDSETEDKIQRAMKNILRKRTTILITHRLSQIRWADLILVLKRGEIVAKGSHEELLKTSEEYCKIFVKRFDIGKDTLLKQCERA